MQLSQCDGDADAGQHAVDDGRRDREADAGNAGAAEGHLDEATQHDRSADQAPVAELLDQTEDDRRQPCRRACNLKGRSSDQACDDAAHDAGDQTCHDRSAGGERDAERQGYGDEEDDQ